MLEEVYLFFFFYCSYDVYFFCFYYCLIDILGLFDGLNRDIIIVYDSDEGSIFRVVFDIEENGVVDLLYYNDDNELD